MRCTGNGTFPSSHNFQFSFFCSGGHRGYGTIESMKDYTHTVKPSLHELLSFHVSFSVLLNAMNVMVVTMKHSLQMLLWKDCLNLSDSEYPVRSVLKRFQTGHWKPAGNVD